MLASRLLSSHNVFGARATCKTARRERDLNHPQRSRPDAERFPPLITPVRLREMDDALAHARRHAAEAGAGTLFHVGRFDLIEFALVLEPEEPLAAARRAMFAGMNALADTIAAACPPERDVRFGYPGSLTFDDGLVGGARLAWPEAAAETDVPDWLVFAAMIRTGGFQEMGFVLDPNATTLEEAGFTDVDPTDFAARFCRHFMTEVDEWLERGFKGVGQRYLSRLPRGGEDGMRGIDGNGDLLIHPKGGGAAVRTPLLPALAAAAWFDPATGMPRA